MEIFRREKKSEWKNIIKDLKNSKICDQERLDSISNSLKEGKTLFESDRVYLESKIKELAELKKSNSLESNPIKTIDQNAEKYLKMIKSLNQKEVGDFARLESISNYLNDGMSILAEDEEYISEKHKQLENKKAWRRNAQPQTILIDDFETNPTHNFDSLSKTISGIIKNSNPHFTIGIYGEWGTGKTTLMRATENQK